MNHFQYVDRYIRALKHVANKPSRRHFLSASAASLGLAGLSGSAWLPSVASQTSALGAHEYRALMIIFLNGGYDGNDTLLFRDAGFRDYQNTRSGLALSKDSLIALAKGTQGQQLGMNPALEPLLSIYNEGRLAWLANVGALVQPVSAAQVKARSVPLPPFLMSHSEQVDLVQGWDPAELPSGWVGRGMEMLGVSPNVSLPIISFSRDNTLVTGQRNSFARADASGGDRNWMGDVTDRSNTWMRQVRYLAQMQPNSAQESEYLRAMADSLSNTESIANAAMRQSSNRVSFPANDLGRDLGFAARLMTHYRSEGAQRQVYFTTYGQFDTHSEQRGDYQGRGLDDQFRAVASAVKAFDDELKARSLDRHVLTLVMTEFGRTLMPAGSGTDHAWGVPWALIGSAVRGGQVYGQMPPPVIGSSFDFDPDGKGRWVPEFAADQVGATLMSWMGVRDEDLLRLSPHLRNFPTAKLALL